METSIIRNKSNIATITAASLKRDDDKTTLIELPPTMDSAKYEHIFQSSSGKEII